MRSVMKSDGKSLILAHLTQMAAGFTKSHSIEVVLEGGALGGTRSAGGEGENLDAEEASRAVAQGGARC